MQGKNKIFIVNLQFDIISLSDQTHPIVTEINKY